MFITLEQLFDFYTSTLYFYFAAKRSYSVMPGEVNSEHYTSRAGSRLVSFCCYSTLRWIVNSMSKQIVNL